jgi:aryl-phospho-beta-D-glucosidase BglC (GH1 family)
MREANLENMPETIDLYDKLYNPESELQEKYVDFWNELAKRFANNDYVIGYDPFNEPFASTYYSDPQSYFSKDQNFDKAVLGPLYQLIFERWEAHDSNQIMMFQPNQAPNVLNKLGGIVNQAGFSSLPGGNSNEQK